MTLDARLKLNPELPLQKRNSKIGDPFHQQMWLKFQEILVKFYFGQIFVWCNFDTFQIKSETPRTFCNEMLKKDGKDQLDRWCER